MTGPRRVRLADYAATHTVTPPGTPSWLATIPEHDEIVAAYQAGIPIIVILDWLVAPPPDGCGYDPKQATRNRVARYLYRRFPRE